MKKTFFLSFFLLIIASSFSLTVSAQTAQINIENYTDCPLDIQFDCYDWCIHYHSEPIHVGPMDIGQIFSSCTVNPTANDIVATVCNPTCNNCVQVDCMSPSYGCGVGTLTAQLPPCPACNQGSTNPINVQFIPNPPGSIPYGTLMITP